MACHYSLVSDHPTIDRNAAASGSPTELVRPVGYVHPIGYVHSCKTDVLLGKLSSCGFMIAWYLISNATVYVPEKSEGDAAKGRRGRRHRLCFQPENHRAASLRFSVLKRIFVLAL